MYFKKFSVFLFLCFSLQVFATDMYSQLVRLTLHLEQVKVKDVLVQIENQSEFYFIYNGKLVDVDRVVNIDVKNQPINDILTQLFDKTDVAIKMVDRQIVLLPSSMEKSFQVATVAQSVTITGTVTDTNGDPLPGAAVSVKGTSQGTATDANGFYSLQVPGGNATLVFSYIGFTVQEVVVGERRTINVTLSEDTRQIEEVVVIGYGTASAKKLTTSVSKIDGNKLTDLPITNVANAFTGNISGVLVEEGSGAPGALPVIRIRGYGSINAGSEPLYVIDGMIVTSAEFAVLNPKSVESVNVLKDAAAGAIYGSRASNGVVIVTTKGGKGNARISYNTTMGLQHIERKIPVLNTAEFIEYTKKAYANAGQTAPVLNPDIADTNWQDEIFRTGFFQNHQLSASGSSEKVDYRVTANYVGNEGIILTTWQNNFSSTGNFGIKLNNKVKFGLTYNTAYIKERFNHKLGGVAHSAEGILETAVIQPPIIPVYMPNGDYGLADTGTNDWGFGYLNRDYGNPVAALKEVGDYKYWFSGMGRAFVNYEPISGLNINLSFNGIVNSGVEDRYESPYLPKKGHAHDANFSNPVYRDMQASQANSLYVARTVDGFVDYKFTLNQKHNVGMIAGFSNEYSLRRIATLTAAVNDRGANAANPLPRFDNNIRPNIWGANDIAGRGTFEEVTFQSLFARLNYDFDNKYLFMASLRRDGSSKFAPGNRYGVFPAASAAWRVSQESFMKNQRLFDDLKFRLSYGVSGNDQIGTYKWQGRTGYGMPQYIYAPNTQAAITEYPSSIENRKLKWETNEQYNVGVDFAILKNRIEMVADWYVRNTTDLILDRPLPAENGLTTSMLDNIGNMTNKGIELMLTTTNVQQKDFVWTTNWIFNKVWNKATKIHTANGIIYMDGGGRFDAIWIKEGEEMFQIYAYKVLGVFKTQEDLTKYPRPSNSQIGDPIIEDVDGNGIINFEDLQCVGKGLPKFTFGWTNTITYKNFDLNVVVDGSQGASKFSLAIRNQCTLQPNDINLSKYVYDRAGELYGIPTSNPTGYRQQQMSYYVFDASYVRIKNATIGYSIPSAICNRMNIAALRLSFGMQNLHTFTKYPWYSPQANFYNGEPGKSQFGVDTGSYPLATSYNLGINLTF